MGIAPPGFRHPHNEGGRVGSREEASPVSPFSVRGDGVSTGSGETLPPLFARVSEGILQTAGVLENIVGGFAGAPSCSGGSRSSFGEMRVV